jgi:hypothetical protein
VSLKSFHILFITASVLLSALLAAYAAMNMNGAARILWIVGSVAFGVTLTWYGNKFIQKMKGIGKA